MFDRIKGGGGLLNLDWHQETACNRFAYADFVTVLDAFLSSAVTDASAWFATPLEVCRHWTELRSRLFSP